MKFFRRLLSPEFWIGIFSLLAAAGLIFAAVGIATHQPVYFHAAFWLYMPLLVSGALLLFVVIPILIVINRKQRKK